MVSTSTSGATMEMLNLLAVLGGVRLDTMRVAKRVQHPVPTGNGMSVRLCKRDDLPVDCPPTMTSFWETKLHVSIG